MVQNKKVNRQSDRKLKKKWNLKNRNHTFKMSRFRVMGQIRERKNGLNTKLFDKVFLAGGGGGGAKEWNQSIGLNILHHICLPQKTHSRPEATIKKIQNMVIFSICPGWTFQ